MAALPPIPDISSNINPFSSALSIVDTAFKQSRAERADARAERGSIRQDEMQRMQLEQARMKMDEVFRAEDAWNNEKEAARYSLVQLSQEYSNAGTATTENQSAAARLLAYHKTEAMFSPTAAGINEGEKARRRLLLSEEPSIQETWLRMADEFSRTPTFNIQGKSYTGAQLTSLLASPGVEGDNARNYLAQADEATVTMLSAAPGVAGKFMPVKGPDGRLRILDARGAREYETIERGLLQRTEGFTAATGKAPTEAPELFTRWNATARQQQVEQLDAYDRASAARADMLRVGDAHPWLRGAGGSGMAGPGDRQQKAVDYPGYVAGLSVPAALVASPVRDLLTSATEVSDEVKFSTFYGLNSLGDVAPSFYNQLQELQKTGALSSQNIRQAYQGAEQTARLLGQFDRISLSNPAAPVVNLRPLAEKLTPEQLSSRANVMLAYLRENRGDAAFIPNYADAAQADAEQYGTSTEAVSDVERQQRITLAANIMTKVPAFRAEDLVTLRQDQLVVADAVIRDTPPGLISSPLVERVDRALAGQDPRAGAVSLQDRATALALVAQSANNDPLTIATIMSEEATADKYFKSLLIDAKVQKAAPFEISSAGSLVTSVARELAITIPEAVEAEASEITRGQELRTPAPPRQGDELGIAPPTGETTPYTASLDRDRQTRESQRKDTTYSPPRVTPLTGDQRERLLDGLSPLFARYRQLGLNPEDARRNLGSLLDSQIATAQKGRNQNLVSQLEEVRQTLFDPATGVFQHEPRVRGATQLAEAANLWNQDQAGALAKVGLSLRKYRGETWVDVVDSSKLNRTGEFGELLRTAADQTRVPGQTAGTATVRFDPEIMGKALRDQALQAQDDINGLRAQLPFTVPNVILIEKPGELVPPQVDARGIELARTRNQAVSETQAAIRVGEVIRSGAAPWISPPKFTLSRLEQTSARDGQLLRNSAEFHRTTQERAREVGAWLTERNQPAIDQDVAAAVNDLSRIRDAILTQVALTSNQNRPVKASTASDVDISRVLFWAGNDLPPSLARTFSFGGVGQTNPSFSYGTRAEAETQVAEIEQAIQNLLIGRYPTAAEIYRGLREKDASPQQ